MTKKTWIQWIDFIVGVFFITTAIVSLFKKGAPKLIPVLFLIMGLVLLYFCFERKKRTRSDRK